MIPAPPHSADDVLLVDETDQPLGRMDKLRAHREGRLHRAFSVLLFNAEGAWMLQQRAAGKYHCSGLWTNTCCSHPRPGEPVAEAAGRRLWEEMGLAAVPLVPLFQLCYRLSLPNGLVEHEYDHVFAGHTSDAPVLNPAEAQAWQWASPDELRQRVQASPQSFTPWFHLIWQKLQTDPAARTRSA